MNPSLSIHASATGREAMWKALKTMSQAGVAMLPLLAQAADPISGGAGWIGAGLLGSVLAWVFIVHLPAKDKQIHFLLEQGRVLAEGLVRTHKESLAEIANNFRQVNEQLSEHCDRELDRMAKLIEGRNNK